MTTLYELAKHASVCDINDLIESATNDGISDQQTLKKIIEIEKISIKLIPSWVSSGGKLASGICGVLFLGATVGVLSGIRNLSPTTTVVFGLFAGVFGVAAHDGYYFSQGLATRIEAISQFIKNLKIKDLQKESALVKIRHWVSGKSLVIDETIAEAIKEKLTESGILFKKMGLVPEPSTLVWNGSLPEAPSQKDL